MDPSPRYYAGDPERCDMNACELTVTFFDAATHSGRWANMCPECFRVYGRGQLGQGLGQKYERQDDGRWLKVEG